MSPIAIRRLSALCALSATVAMPAAAADAKPARDSYVLPTPPTQFPEGVAYDERSGRYYVSSQSNGAILTGFLKTARADILAVPGDAGREHANGLDTDRQWRKLWVATGQQGRVDLLNPRSGATLRTFSMAEGSYANDVAVQVPDHGRHREGPDARRQLPVQPAGDEQPGAAVHADVDPDAVEVALRRRGDRRALELPVLVQQVRVVAAADHGCRRRARRLRGEQRRGDAVDVAHEADAEQRAGLVGDPAVAHPQHDPHVGRHGACGHRDREVLKVVVRHGGECQRPVERKPAQQ